MLHFLPASSFDAARSEIMANENSVLLRVAYDGTDFHGYAAQKPNPEPVRTVQGELEEVLSVLYKRPIATRAASRTDAGVHAYGQLVAFEPPTRIPLPGLARGLNSKLPNDVSILAAWEEPDVVDVRAGNKGKYYRYRMRCSEVADPLARRYEWYLGRRLDPGAMKSAAQLLVGTHDFASFRSSTCQARTTERTIRAVEITFGPSAVGPMGDLGRIDPVVHKGEPQPGPVSAWGPDWVEVHVWGDAFLHNMVRIIVGTLVEVGVGRREPASIEELLTQPDRTKAGITAPPSGLVLVEVAWRRSEDATST
jgi:tRNA pseudouridine38-40 synthase